MKILIIFLFILLCVVVGCKREEPTVKKIVNIKCRKCNTIISSDTTIIPLPERFRKQKSPPKVLRESKTTVCDECKKIKLEPVFDIPSLLKMSISKIKTKLGKPKNEFKPTIAQRKIDPTWLSDAEFQKGTTNIIIDYNRNGKVESIFISDNKAGRTKIEIMQLGNLQLGSKEYSIRIQKWLNPAKAKGKSTIAGIEVKPRK